MFLTKELENSENKAKNFVLSAGLVKLFLAILSLFLLRKLRSIDLFHSFFVLFFVILSELQRNNKFLFKENEFEVV